MEDTDGLPARRPGGRSARVRAQVLAAAEELLNEGGSERLAIGPLAERSGVHHATIYRRWGSVEGVVADLAAERVARESPIPDTGSLRTDLLAYGRGAAASIAAPDGLNLVKGLILAADHRPGSESPLQARGAAIQAMLDRAADRGETPLDVTDVLDHLIAPIYFRRIFGLGDVDDEVIVGLVNRVLAKATADQPTASRSTT